jgi:hypothetical protein
MHLHRRMGRCEDSVGPARRQRGKGPTDPLGERLPQRHADSHPSLGRSRRLSPVPPSKWLRGVVATHRLTRSPLMLAYYGGLLKPLFRLFVAFALTAFVSTSLVAAPATAVTRAATSASVTVSASSISPGQALIVRGTLKKGASAFAGARVALQVRLMGSTTWSLLKSAVTSPTGQISTTVWPSRNHEFRLVFSGWSSATPLRARSGVSSFVRQPR